MRFVGGETHFYLGRRHQRHIVNAGQGKYARLLRGKQLGPSRYPWSECPDVQALRAAEARCAELDRMAEIWLGQEEGSRTP